MALPIVGKRQAVKGEQLTLIRDGGTLVWVSRKDFRSYPPYTHFFNRLRQARVDLRNIVFGQVNYHVTIPVGAELLLDVWSGSGVEWVSDGPTTRAVYNGSFIGLLHQIDSGFVEGCRYTLNELGEFTGVTVVQLPSGQHTEAHAYERVLIT